MEASRRTRENQAGIGVDNEAASALCESETGVHKRKRSERETNKGKTNHSEALTMLGGSSSRLTDIAEDLM